MPKKLKGVHVFWPLVQQATWGKVDLVLLQTHLLSVPLPCHNPPLAKTTLVMKTPLQHLLLLYPLTHHPLPSQPTVVPSVNILLTNPLVLCLPFPTPTPMPMTSCLFQMQMFLLAVRPAQAQSDRRLMVHQPSYQLARNSRSLTIPSRTYWNQRRQIRDRSDENGQAPLSTEWRWWLLFRSRIAPGWANCNDWLLQAWSWCCWCLHVNSNANAS